MAEYVTIADTFAMDWDKNSLREKLEELLASLKSATAVGDHDEFFGPKKQVKVTILDMSEELIKLHYRVVELLESAGVVFSDPHYTKEGVQGSFDRLYRNMFVSKRLCHQVQRSQYRRYAPE